MANSIHLRTPSVTANDGRGLALRQIAYLRTVPDGPVDTLITRLRNDVAGHPIEQQDPRLSVAGQITVFALSGQPLKVRSVDAGTNVVLPGRSGEVLQRWDARDNHRFTTYDHQLRPLNVRENGTPDIETFTYADCSADPGYNLRGQLIEQSDASGTVEFHSVGMTGHGLRETRTFHDGKAFVSRRAYGPLGTVLTQTDAGGHQQLSTYDVAGQLNRVQLQINGQSTWQTVLQDAQYNASGQIIEQQAGNAVISHWHYHADGRLHRHFAHKGSGPVLQDFEYKYDRMGNITCILDHAYTPTYFRNQRINGHRELTYDTLYRLIRATGYSDAAPSDNLGRPQPTAPDDRRNYIEHYNYDHGDNLVKTVHVRDGTSHTFEMCIDSASNRGVRCKPGDPPPDFSRLFDRAGNLQALQPGVLMHWNRRGELDKVTLVDRNGGSANDQEYYRYSQGERVYKRHDTHTTKVSHFHEVRYLPGLEIRTRDNGEELHLINLSLASGNAVCLHWKAGKPPRIDADQLRYTLADHLGSVSLELDRQAQIISREGYLSFGATAWMAARALIEVDYRFLRYSGKEMDVTRLYYYGARYYACWLGRWVSADPAGPVDGPNLYAFVGNNPVNHVDVNGEAKVKWPTVADINAGVDRIIASQNASYSKNRQAIATRHMKDQMSQQVTRHIEILGLTKERASDAAKQLDRMGSGLDVALAATRRTLTLIIGKGISYGVGVGVGIGAQALGAVAPGVGNVVGAGLGIGAKIAVSGLIDYVAERTGMSAPVNLKTSKLTAKKIIQKAEYKQMEPFEYLKAKYQNMKPDSQKSQLKFSKEAATQASGYILKSALTSMPSEAVSAIGTGVAVLLGLPEIVDETMGALSDKSGAKMLEFERQILGLVDEIESSNATIHGFANALSTTSIGGIDLDDLDRQTRHITDMLHGLADTVRHHRASQKAAA